MKILWISHFLLFPETGYGALQRSRNLLLELSQQHEIILLSYYRNVDLKLAKDLDKAKQNLEKYCKRIFLIPFPADQVKWSSYKLMIKSMALNVPYSILLYRSGYLEKNVVDVINKFDIDVVHADTMGLIDQLLDKINIPKVLNHHNIESHMMLRRAQIENNLLKKLIMYKEAYQLAKYENRYCPNYDLNIVVSKVDCNRLKKISKNNNMAVIKNAVDCNYFIHNLRDEKSKGLIFNGTLDWYPNLEAVLFFCKEVWPMLKVKYTELTFTIIGRNPSDKLLSLIKKEKNIFLVKEFIPDLREHIRNAKIFVCPIRDGGGTKLKILDALAQGIPIVSTSIGCEGINVIDEENIMIANTPNEFVKQISLLMSDEKLCKKLSGSGRRLVEQYYSFSIIGKKLSNLYEQLAFNSK